MTNEGQDWFVTTRWSVVLAAGRTDSTKALAALEDLCRTYWYPLYAFVRRLGHKPEDAEDLVQSFFAQCIRKNYLTSVDQTRGRFRTFLLVALKRFVANEWDKARAQKRGGAQRVVSFEGLEQKYAGEPADSTSADKLFDRRWALTLLETVLKRLEEEHRAAGKMAGFDRMKPFLVAGGEGAPYAQIAAELNMSEAAVKVAIHRLRGRYRKLLEEEIAHTVGSSEEVDEERRYLLRVMAGE